MSTQHNHSELPEKIGSVDRLVTIPEEIEKVLAGKKSAVRRNGRYADVGETMTLQGKEFVIEKVYSQALGELTDEHARQEGYENVEEYKQSILSLHPGMPWLPQMRVWVHEFRPVQG